MRYPFLRIISTLMGILGVVVMIGGFAAFIVLLPARNVGTLPLLVLGGGVSSGVGLMLTSGLIKLLLDIEANTRATALVLRRREQRMVAQQTEQPRDPARLDRLGEAPIREPVEPWQRPAVPRKILMK